MTNVFVAAVFACVLTAVFGRLLIPVLRALKAGQSIRESGPTWHNYKSGISKSHLHADHRLRFVFSKNVRGHMYDAGIDGGRAYTHNNEADYNEGDMRLDNAYEKA